MQLISSPLRHSKYRSISFLHSWVQYEKGLRIVCDIVYSIFIYRFQISYPNQGYCSNPGVKRRIALFLKSYFLSGVYFLNGYKANLLQPLIIAFIGVNAVPIQWDAIHNKELASSRLIYRHCTRGHLSELVRNVTWSMMLAGGAITCYLVCLRFASGIYPYSYYYSIYRRDSHI